MIQINLSEILAKIDRGLQKRATLTKVAQDTGLSIVTLSRIKNKRTLNVRGSTIAFFLTAYPFLRLSDFIGDQALPHWAERLESERAPDEARPD